MLQHRNLKKIRIITRNMDYAITFLGTAGGRSAVNNALRFSGGFILNFEGIQFHVDPGPGSILNAAKFNVDLRNNNVILVSHNHLDHCNDLNHVIDVMTDSGREKRGILITNKSVLFGNGEKPYLMKFYKNSLEKCYSLEHGKEAKVNNIIIKALKTNHYDKTGIGFKFFTKKFVLSYTGDTEFSKDVVDEYKNSDILIINNQNSFLGRGKTLSSKNSVDIINEVKPSLVLLTHFGSELIKNDPLYEAREIQKLTNIQTIAARDGMVVEPLSYSPHLKQKNLYQY